MLSDRTTRAALALGFVLACVGNARAEEDRATPQEVIQRVQQAVQHLAKSGEAGLATFSSKNATSVWKDSYTFVVSCEGGTAVGLANPVRPGASPYHWHKTSPSARNRASRLPRISVRPDGSRTAGGWNTTSPSRGRRRRRAR